MSELFAQSPENFKSVVNSLSDSIIVLKVPECHIAFVNKAFIDLFGRGESESLNKFMDIIFTERLDYLHFYNTLREDLKSCGRKQYELTGKNNNRFNAEITYRPMTTADETPSHTLVTITEISETKPAGLNEEKLREHRFQLQKMEALARFTSGIAHDFNNLLTCIQGYSKLAVNEVKENGRLKEDVEQIYSASERAAFLTRQLLFFSRKQPMKSGIFSVNQSIRNLLNITRWIIGDNIRVRTELPENIWSISADEVRIKQVITDMLINSRDALPNGGEIFVKTENIEIDDSYIEAYPEAKRGKHIRITIRDDGIGMSEETISHIFEPYFTTKEMDKGAGLGLFIAYGIITQHEGWIDFESAPGRGACLRIYLPAVFFEEQRKKTKAVLLQDYNGHGEKILLIEDESSVREFAEQALTMYGYVVFSAETGKEALKLFEKEKNNLSMVISDIVLNDADALELAEIFLKEKPGLKILLSSGYTDKKLEVRQIAQKGFKFLQKPYSVEELLQCVKELMLT